VGKGETPEFRDIPFASRFLRHTPEEMIENKEENEYIEKSMAEVSKKRFYENKEIKQLLKFDKDIDKYISEQPDKEQYRLFKKIFPLLKKKDISDIGWYERIKSLPPEIRGKVFANKYNKSNPEIKEKMYESALRVGGILTPATLKELK